MSDKNEKYDLLQVASQFCDVITSHSHVEFRDERLQRKFDSERRFLSVSARVHHHARHVGRCETERDVTRHMEHLDVDEASLKHK